MHIGQIVFAQLMDVLPLHEFHKCVHRYGGDRKVQRFSCLDQFLCMAFAQLTYRESLRDIESGIPIIPHGYPGQHISQHLGLCQRNQRLAHLR